jgi:hypothetical protein
MKSAKFTLMFLACAAANSAFAQNTPDSNCGTTNFDRSRNAFTVINAAPGTSNQQCFITVVPKQQWTGGMPDPTTSRFIEGNYEVELSGGGGGGGGAARRVSANDGDNAVPIKRTRYLSPGVYRMTLGAGGQGGQSCLTRSEGGNGQDGAPTNLSAANNGQTVLGYARAESWDRRTAQPYQVAGTMRNRSDDASERGSVMRTANVGQFGGGGRGADGGERCENAGAGGNGFVRLALTDTIVQVQPEIVVQPQPQPEPTGAVGQAAPPPPVETRPARIDRN